MSSAEITQEAYDKIDLFLTALRQHSPGIKAWYQTEIVSSPHYDIIRDILYGDTRLVDFHDKREGPAKYVLTPEGSKVIQAGGIRQWMIDRERNREEPTAQSGLAAPIPETQQRKQKKLSFWKRIWGR